MTLNVGGRIARSGEELEAPRDETLEQWLSAGFVTEVETRREATARRKASGNSTRRG